MSYYFIRHSKLNLPYKNHSEIPFKVMVDLGLNKLSPEVDNEYTKKQIIEFKNKINLEKIDVIYSSPAQRCRETARYLKNLIGKEHKIDLPIIVVPEISEIIFDLSILEDKSQDIQLINHFVFEQMISGENAENYKNAFTRIDSFLKEVKKQNFDNAIFITHDFIMRIIELYIKNKGNILKNLTINNLQNTRRNDYLTGFSVNNNFSEFDIIKNS